MGTPLGERRNIRHMETEWSPHRRVVPAGIYCVFLFHTHDNDDDLQSRRITKYKWTMNPWSQQVDKDQNERVRILAQFVKSWSSPAHHAISNSVDGMNTNVTL